MTLPNYSGGGFYRPDLSYRSSGGNINLKEQMPGLYNIYGTEQNAQGVFDARLAQMGLGGFGSRARTAQGLFGKSMDDYRAAQAGSNAELFYPEFLDTARLNRTINSLSQEAQGLDPQKYQARYRWGLRPVG